MKIFDNSTSKAWKAIAGGLHLVVQLILPLPLALYVNAHRLDGASAGDCLEASAGKGQGLASVCSIVAAATGVAMSLTWGDSTMVAKVLLAGASAYCAISLWALLAVVDAVQRSPARLSNLLNASRSDVLKALLLFSAWGIIALTGNATLS